MKRKLLISLIAVISTLSCMAADQWRIHPTWYGSVRRIFDTKDYVYVLSNNQPYWSFVKDYSKISCSLYRYAKADGDLVYLNISNLLSSPVLQNAEYNYDKKYLLAAYTDGTIDLIHDTGDVTTIRGLALSGDNYDTAINDITFDPANNRAYLATNFGYLVLNDKKGEVETTMMLDSKVNSAAAYDGKIFLALDKGVFVTDPKSADPMHQEAVDGTGPVVRMFPLGNTLYTFGGEGWNGTVSAVTPEANGYYSGREFVKNYIQGVEQIEDKLLVCAYSQLWTVDTSGEITAYQKSESEYEKYAVSSNGRDFWVDQGAEGVLKKRTQPDSNIWTATGEIIRPNASNAYKCTSIVYHPKYGMLVRNHGSDRNFVSHLPEVPDYISGVKNLEWTPYSLEMTTGDLKQLGVSTPSGIAIDPNNQDQVYCGSQLRGLLRLDLSNPRKSYRIGRKDDEAVGLSQFVGYLENDPTSDYRGYATVGPPKFDNAGNLWTVYNNYLTKDKSQKMELWCWTPQDRAASTTSANFREPQKFTGTSLTVGVNMMTLPLTGSTTKNMVVVVSTGDDDDILLLDHKGTLDNRSDDKVTVIKKLVDQSGAPLPYLNHTAVYEDKSTGNVWLGMDIGVCYFDPKTMLNAVGGEGQVVKPKVARNDGTNFADYLLDGVGVNVIVEDPQGRKWFGTNGGGIVITNSTGTQVLKSYTSSNSMLPDDFVYAIGYNPEAGSMMISTGSGLAELYLQSVSEGTDGDSVKVYPNPVRPDYYGYVEIEGLEDGALVKITDSGGNMIKELGFASDGMARWDVTNHNMKRVRSGVYYVMASSGPDSTGFGAVAKILVVN